MIIKSQNGDINATTKLVETNIKLVWRIGRQAGIIVADSDYNNDSTQDGIEGLLIAIRKFNIDSGLRLSTYSSHWILQGMQRPKQRGDYSGFMSNPVHHASVCRLLRHIIISLDIKLDKFNVWEEYLKEVERRDINNQYGKAQVLASLEYLQSSNFSGYDAHGSDDSEEYSESIFDDIAIKQDSPEEVLTKERMKAKLEYALEDCKSLNERDALIIRMRFGIGAYEPSTLEEIGVVVGVVRERVRQVQNSALIKLKRYLKFEGITKMSGL